MKMLDKILERMEHQGLKQKALEGMAGLAPNRIAKWNGGQGEPTARQALRIARALKVPVEWLVDDDAPAEPPQATPAEPELSYGERVILDIVRARGIDHHTAIRRLLPAVGYESVPPTGDREQAHNGGQTG